MEDFKGTKGWNAKHESTEFCDTGDYEYHATIEDEKGRCIAQFFAKDEDQREADCNLAAAAPELLELHLKFLEMFSEYDMRPEDELHEYASEVMDVIAKALGKEADNE